MTDPRRVFLAALLGTLGIQAPALAQQGFESPSTVKAAEFLPADAMKGPHYRVADQANRDGALLRFEIESDYGQFEAPSREMALLRIDEVAAIAKLEEIGSSEAFAKALAASVEQKATAVAQVVTDPGETVKGVGRGMKRLWGKGKKAAAGAADRVKNDGGEDSGDRPSAGGVATSLLGVDKSMREIARAAGADPYTSNPRLRQELQRLGKAAAAGGITGKLGPRVPGLDTAASVGELAWSLPPEDLRERNEKALDGIGCDAACRKPLFANAAYTPSLETRLVDTLVHLEGLEDRKALVELAAGAENEVEARFYCGSLALLGKAAARGRGLAYGRVPAAMAPDGALVVAGAVDHLAWTEDLAEAAARPVEGASRRDLWITGAVTERAKAGLAAGGWTLHERTPIS